MSSISNRFFVTALEDGTTLHGNLSATKPLSQGWNGTSAVPDWTQSANQPIIYLTLLNGTQIVQPTSNFKWLYNGTEITFGNDNVSTSPVGLFQKTTHTYTYGGTQVTMPALKVIGNLAGYGGNVDMDTITFDGAYSAEGSNITFQATAQIRVTQITKGGYLGLINFVNGVSDITFAGQDITMYASLFGGEDGGSIAITQSDVRWYINDVLFNATTHAPSHLDTVTVDTTQYPALVFNEANITDHATIRCDFLQSGEVKYSAYVGIDDMQDPEFLYIQYNGANGNAASLRKDEGVLFFTWVGKREDPTIDTAYTSYKVKLLDGDGDVIMDSNIPDGSQQSSVNNPDANGWRTMNISSTSPNSGKAYINIIYSVVNTLGKKNLTGIILAQTASA